LRLVECRLAFVESVKNDLGIKAMHREVLKTDGTSALCEPAEAYARNFTGENEALSSENTLPWNESLRSANDADRFAVADPCRLEDIWTSCS
jgi:hypothetical protein